MTVALYATIWLSLIALVLSEVGRQRQRVTLARAHWPIVWSAIGVVAGVVHSIVALDSVYHWDHALAVQLTASRAAELYGIAWAGSLYVNYLFLAWWTTDTVWWALSPDSFIRRSSAIEWLWRLLVFTMVVNGAVIFASPAGRIAGIPLTAVLLWAWRPGRT